MGLTVTDLVVPQRLSSSSSSRRRYVRGVVSVSAAQSRLQSAAILAIAPIVLPMGLLLVIAPWLAHRFGLRVVIVTSLLIIAAGLLSITPLTTHSPYRSC